MSNIEFWNDVVEILSDPDKILLGFLLPEEEEEEDQDMHFGIGIPEIVRWRS